MKQIESVTIWSNGEQKTASILKAKIAMDNLQNACSFSYELCEGGQGTEETPLIIGQTLAQGSVTMTGEDYLAWDNSNEAAYSYIAEKLNIMIFNSLIAEKLNKIETT